MRCASGVQVREHFTYKLGLSAHTPSIVFSTFNSPLVRRGEAVRSRMRFISTVFYSGQFFVPEAEAGQGQGLRTLP